MKIEFAELSTNVSRVTLPCAVQAKYDGELVVWKGGCLNNRNGRERWGLPCVQGLDPKTELIGELYWDTGKQNFYEGMTYLKNDSPLLKFAVFAFYNGNMTYAEQIHLLGMLNLNPQRKIAESMNAYSHLELEHFHAEYMTQGFEGSVIKPLASKSVASWTKWKPDETMDLVVLGISKKHSAIAVGKPDGEILGHCSLLGKEKEADLLLGKLNIIGDTKEDYLIGGKVVVEVKHLGVIDKSGHLRSPRIARFREDKCL